MAGERLTARFQLRGKLFFRWTGKCFETATSHMQTVLCERGTEFSRQRTFEKKEILFWIFDSITFSMASNLELANRRENEDSRVQLFEIQEQLIRKIDPEYAETLHKKHQRLLK